MSFEDVQDAQRFISLVHEATGLFADVQSPSIANIGDVGVIDPESASFLVTRTRPGAGDSVADRSPPSDYVFYSHGVTVNGPFAASNWDLTAGVTFQGQQDAAILVVHQAIRMVAKPATSSSTSGEQVIQGLYYTRSYAVLLATTAFTATIRTEEGDAGSWLWHAQTSSSAWKTFTGDHLTTPLLVLSSASDTYELPWNEPNRDVLDIPERSPLPREIWLELFDNEETTEGRIPEVDPTPTELWIDLADTKDTQEGRVPEVNPNPIELWAELRDIEETTEGRIPEVSPFPREILVELEANDILSNPLPTETLVETPVVTPKDNAVKPKPSVSVARTGKEPRRK